VIVLVSVQEIANLANVSQSTVSKVLNNYHDVSEKTRKKVLEIANQLGYVPNATAISLVKRKSSIIGVIYEVTSGFGNLFFSAILESFRSIAESNGFTIILLSQNEEKKKEYWMHCVSHNIESVFIISTKDQSIIESELKNHGIATLTLDPLYESSSPISTDNFDAMQLSLSYLYDLGHRAIAFIQGSLHSYVGKERLNAYLHFVKEKNLPTLFIPHIDNALYSLQQGYDTASSLLNHFDQMDAIACCSDVLAMGAIYCLQDHGYHVPNDISIMGFDDLRISEITRPRLSTIRQDSMLIGKIACETLLSMNITNQTTPPILIKASLVVRNSTKKKETSHT
jgi:LacI family transcriptional regulator